MSTAIAAPRAAPDAVPRMYGSARGLRIRPWSVAPATASPAPTSMAVRTRGTRRSHTIVSVASDQVRPRSRPSVRQRMTPIVSPGPIRADPSVTPATSRTPSATSPATAIRPGRARMRSARPSVPRSVETAVTDTSTLNTGAAGA